MFADRSCRNLRKQQNWQMLEDVPTVPGCFAESFENKGVGRGSMRKYITTGQLGYSQPVGRGVKQGDRNSKEASAKQARETPGLAARLGLDQVLACRSRLTNIEATSPTLTFHWRGPSIHLECLLEKKKNASSCSKARWIC